MTAAIKYFFYLLLIGLLWMPLLQQNFSLVKEEPLHGAFTPPDSAVLSKQSWFSSEFQEKFVKYTEYHIGFHQTGVRIHNQLSYWSGEQPKNVVVGKENCLMGNDYIDAYLGKDFVGADSIEHECVRLKRLQDLLGAHHITFFVVVAPSKSRVHPEFIPSFYHPERRTPGNYEHYVESFKKYNIHFLDFERWFELAKDTSRYPMYTYLGVHWSIYGFQRATDSLLGYMSKLSCCRINRMKFSGVKETDEASDTDDDLLKLMNLLFPIRQPHRFAYIQSENAVDSTCKKPRVLAVGDSHYWNIINMGVPKTFFADSSAYFYYNSTAFFNVGEPRDVPKLDIYREVMSKDIVFLIYTDPNLKMLGNYFPETILELAKKRGEVY